MAGADLSAASLVGRGVDLLSDLLLVLGGIEDHSGERRQRARRELERTTGRRGEADHDLELVIVGRRNALLDDRRRNLLAVLQLGENVRDTDLALSSESIDRGADETRNEQLVRIRRVTRGVEVRRQNLALTLGHSERVLGLLVDTLNGGPEVDHRANQLLENWATSIKRAEQVLAIAVRQHHRADDVKSVAILILSGDLDTLGKSARDLLHEGNKLGLHNRRHRASLCRENRLHQRKDRLHHSLQIRDRLDLDLRGILRVLRSERLERERRLQNVQSGVEQLLNLLRRRGAALEDVLHRNNLALGTLGLGHLDFLVTGFISKRFV